jgi:hypothetical protein
MQRRAIATRGFIVGALILQLVPLILFPPESFTSKSQEWWLPALLASMVLVACVELILRGSHQLWPWHLMSFSQGFNIISRLMMLWPHATKTVGGATVLNVPYVALTITSMGMSAVLLWYLELPDVRIGLLRE